MKNNPVTIAQRHDAFMNMTSRQFRAWIKQELIDAMREQERQDAYDDDLDILFGTSFSRERLFEAGIGL